MQLDESEENLLRSVALQNARAILLARERAERELIQTKQELERKSEELRQQREWFEVTLSSIGDAVITTDLHGKITFLNPVAEKMTGWTSADAGGQQLGIVFRIILEHTRQPVPDPIAKAFREGAVVGLANHTLLIAKDGREIAIEDSAAPIKDARGNICGAVMVFHDITERRKAEEELRASEARLRGLADSIPQLAWMAEPDGHIFWYNRRWYEYTGATFEQMQGWGWQSVHDPRILPQVLERWTASIRTGYPFEMEYPLRNRDGGFRWFLTRVIPVRDTGGRVVRWFGTNTDVDQDKRTREALQEQTCILELLTKTGSAIGSQLNLESLVQTVTDAATELSGARFGAFFYYVTNEKGESSVLYALSGASREAIAEFGLPENIPAFNPTFHGEGVIRSADITQDPRYGPMAPLHGMGAGHLPIRSYLAAPVFSRSGEVIGGLFFGHPEPGVFTEGSERIIIGVAAQAAVAIDNARLYEAGQREIAERRRAEAELQAAKDELEQRVQERTASLRDTTEQLETFCYTIAHDLRSPLRAQQSFAKVLLDDYAAVLDEDAQDYANRIIKSAQRMDTLVNDLLAYSRLSRTALKFEQVDLNKVMAEVLAYLAEDIQTQGATIDIGLLHPVLAYQPVLEMVITNLVCNALKFTRPGVAPRVHVRSERRDDFVRVWVEDNGIGISPEYAGKIFGVFERLHPIDTYPGTGIGLAIVHKGVERMGGRVGVESELGSGSRFWIELPRSV